MCNDRPVISFIVPAHNERRLVGATLDAIHAAASVLQLRFELLVVDDASDDDTGDVARAHGAEVLRVAHRHIAATRNAGARATSGEYLAFVDADTLVDARVLAAAMTALDDGIVGGGAAVRLGGRLAWHERVLVAVSIWGFRRARVAPGCFVFCTRDAFEAVGGFDERYYAGEDVAISRALARHGRFTILREAVVTSARKLRTHPLREQLALLVRFAWQGRRMLHSRDALGLWYGGRRDE